MLEIIFVSYFFENAALTGRRQKRPPMVTSVTLVTGGQGEVLLSRPALTFVSELNS